MGIGHRALGIGRSVAEGLGIGLAGLAHFFEKGYNSADLRFEILYFKINFTDESGDNNFRF